MCTQYLLCNVLIRVNMSTFSNIYHFFMVETFKIFSSSFLNHAVHIIIWSAVIARQDFLLLSDYDSALLCNYNSVLIISLSSLPSTLFSL
jgi:predicted transglutaminase-like protease